MPIKKLLIISISVFITLFIAVVVLLLVLNLKAVDLNFVSTTENIDGSEEEIIQTGEFNYNESIFFIDKQTHKEKIEKQNPYIKVLSLETVFPNKLIIHAAEREEVFALEDDGETFILDDEFKVLNIDDNYSNETSNSIELVNLEVDNEPDLADVIQFQDANKTKIVEDLIYEIQTWDNNFVNIKANIKQIEVTKDLEYEAFIKSWPGVQIEIKNPLEEIDEKVQVGFNIYDSSNDYRYDGDIQVFKNEEDSEVVGVHSSEE